MPFWAYAAAASVMLASANSIVFILIGESLFFHSTNVLIWATCFFFINTVYFIFSEEPGLQARFGDDYRQYKEHVPRWIPRLTP